MFNVVLAVLGVALLVAGRKVFWLFIGAAGFVTGIQLTLQFFHGREGLAIIIGLVIGLIFAALAIFLETIAIGIAGFLAGGYVLLVVGTILGLDKGASLQLILYIVGGIIGVLLVSFLFDWAIITLSSLAGASLIVQALQFQRATSGLIFIALFLGGVILQGSILRNEKEQEHSENQT